jgi:hypothetical protein
MKLARKAWLFSSRPRPPHEGGVLPGSTTYGLGGAPRGGLVICNCPAARRGRIESRPARGGRPRGRRAGRDQSPAGGGLGEGRGSRPPALGRSDAADAPRVSQPLRTTDWPADRAHCAAFARRPTPEAASFPWFCPSLHSPGHLPRRGPTLAGTLHSPLSISAQRS